MKKTSSSTSLNSLDIPHSTKKAKKLYKKSPDAPKRFKSAYICYITEKMEEARVNEPSDSKATDVMKTLAIQWRDLPANEREKYIAMAEADKARYFAEMATYDGPMQVLNKRAKKPEDAPKRAMSAFLSFSQTMRPEVRQKYPNLKNMELSSLLAQMWREASDEVKRPHSERESKEREKYHEEMAKWKKEESVRLERDKHSLAETIRTGGSVMSDIPFGYPPQMFSHFSTNNPGNDEDMTADMISASAAYWSQLQGQRQGGPSLKYTDNHDVEYDNEENNLSKEMNTRDSTNTTYPKKMLPTSSSSSSLTTGYDGSEGSRDLKDSSQSLSTSQKKRRSKNKKSPQNPALSYEGWQSGFAAIATASANHTSQAMGNLGIYLNFPWLLHGAQGAMMQQSQQQQQQSFPSSSGYVNMNDSNVAGTRDGMMASSTMGPPVETSKQGQNDTNENDGNDGGSTQPPPQKQQRQSNYQLSSFQAYLLQQQYQHQQYIQLAQQYQIQYQRQLQRQTQPSPLPPQERAEEKQAYGSDDGMTSSSTNVLPHGNEDCDITESFFDRDAGGLSPLFFDVEDGERTELVPAVAAADKQTVEAEHQQRMFLWQQWEQQQIQAQTAMNVAQQRARQFYRSAPSSSDTLASYASHASAQSAVTSVASYSSAISSAPSFDFDLVNLGHEPQIDHKTNHGEQYLPRPQTLQGSARFHTEDSVHLVSPRTMKMEADNGSTSQRSPGNNAEDAISVTQALRNAYQATQGLVNIADDVHDGDTESRKRAFSDTEETQCSSAINF